MSKLDGQEGRHPERPLLHHVPIRQRGHFMNLFLAPPRAGCTNPQEVVAQVTTELQRTLQRRRPWVSEEQLEPLRQDILLVISHPGEALTLAQEAIDYVALPPREQERLKAKRQRVSTGHLPATEKQLAYLRALGHHGPVDSRTHASQLINMLKAQKGGVR
jgi:hypothetical protein